MCCCGEENYSIAHESDTVERLLMMTVHTFQIQVVSSTVARVRTELVPSRSQRPFAPPWNTFHSQLQEAMSAISFQTLDSGS